MSYSVEIVREDWIAEHPEVAQRFVKALAQAQDFLTRRPTEAMAIVKQRMKPNDAYVDSVWSQIQFGLSLDQSLVAAMEDEARWLIANKLTPTTQVPAFLDHVFDDALRKIRPDAVGIIR